MSRTATGWTFVAIQALLLGALILLPGRDDWATPGRLRIIGFILILGGLAIGAVAAVAVVTLAFFTAKAKWEEARLAERYYDYSDYAERTPRFVPRPWRKRRTSDRK